MLRSTRDRNRKWYTVERIVNNHFFFLATGTFLYGPTLFFDEIIFPADRSILTYLLVFGFFTCTTSRFFATFTLLEFELA